ncbi:hypothetical protein BH24ACT1_BH24ACT1_10100 [soil metagenome]
MPADRPRRGGTPPLPPGRHVELPGRGTTFVRELEGPPGAPTLLLLHGWTAGSDLTWFACFEELGRHFRVISMDHRGHGRGMRTRARFSLEDCADDVAALIEVLGLGSTGNGCLLVAGYSLGGCVAQLLWRRHRASVDGLVLCSTSAVFAESPVERRYFAGLGALALASRATPAPLRRRLAQRIVGRRVGDSALQEWILEELRRSDPTAVLEAGRALGGFDSRTWIGELDIPAAVVVTTSDRQVLPARQLALARAIPASTVHEVAASHDACVSAPRRFLPAFVAACQSAVSRATAGAAARSG